MIDLRRRRRRRRRAVVRRSMRPSCLSRPRRPRYILAADALLRLRASCLLHNSVQSSKQLFLQLLLQWLQ